MADFIESVEENSLNYMYSFSDSELIGIIENPREWEEAEIELAKKILKQRGLSELIKDADKRKKQAKQKKIARNSAFYFLLIAFLWVLNFFIGQEGEFILGFGIPILNERFFWLLPSLLIGIIFQQFIFFKILAFYIWVWLKSRNQNQKIYLAGMIVYGFDTLYLIYLTLLVVSSYNGAGKEWFSVVLHFSILWILYKGYKALKESKK